MKEYKKFYLATSYENRSQARDIAESVSAISTFLYSFPWFVIEPEAEKTESMQLCLAKNELRGIEDCDIFIMVWPVRKGSWVELGYALAKKKPILLCMNKTQSLEYLPPFTRLENIIRITIEDKDFNTKTITQRIYTHLHNAY